VECNADGMRLRSAEDSAGRSSQVQTVSHLGKRLPGRPNSSARTVRTAPVSNLAAPRHQLCLLRTTTYDPASGGLDLPFGCRIAPTCSALRGATWAMQGFHVNPWLFPATASNPAAENSPSIEIALSTSSAEVSPLRGKPSVLRGRLRKRPARPGRPMYAAKK